jgi:hypothetical protein
MWLRFIGMVVDVMFRHSFRSLRRNGGIGRGWGTDALASTAEDDDASGRMDASRGCLQNLEDDPPEKG